MSWGSERNEYNCWLGYNQLEDIHLVNKYRDIFGHITIIGKSSIFESTQRELEAGLEGIIGIKPDITADIEEKTSVFIMKTNHEIVKALLQDDIEHLAEEGFMIKSAVYKGKDILMITGKTERGILYGSFHLLRQLQMGKDISELDYMNNPSSPLRMINHWDNLDGSIER